MPFLFSEFDMPDTTPFLDDLLIRKRGAYGPWGLYHLDSGSWAVVWEACLEDEDACECILYESPAWFNVEPERDGRRPNPTYSSQQSALVEIIRQLLPMLEAPDGIQHSAVYHTYMNWAHADLLVPLLDWPMSASYPHDMPQSSPISELLLTVSGDDAEVSGELPTMQSESAPTPSAAAPVETQAEPVQTPSAAAEAVPVAKKPWEDLSRGSKGMNFQPDPELYAKMMWCKENVPMMALLRILRDGANRECDRLIELYYKP